METPYPKGGGIRNEGASLKSQGVSETRGQPPIRTEGNEGNPIEGNPKKKGNAPALSPAERITKERELERVRTKMKVIRDNYSGHQSWTKDDRELFKDLGEREVELKQLLGVRF